MDETARRSALAAVLAWHEAMGADAAVSDTAIDWLARAGNAPGADYSLPGADVRNDATVSVPGRPAPAIPVVPQQRASLLPATQTSHPRPAVNPATERITKPLAAWSVKAQTLAGLEAELRAYDGCGLKATASNLCFYRGADKARLMIIGEAPGRDEDIEGKPFVGRAGQLLDKMLTSIGLTAEQVHITNVVYWRPPGNRTPSPAEAIQCAPFLSRQIELVEPDVLMLLGAVAAKQILDTADGILRLRGNWFETSVNGRTIKTMPSLHPAYLLRTPAAKRQAWRDFLAVKAALY